MKTHFIDSDGQIAEGTAQYPANTGMYLVIKTDGKASVEPYTVALGWMNFPAWFVCLSSYLGPLKF